MRTYHTFAFALLFVFVSSTIFVSSTGKSQSNTSAEIETVLRSAFGMTVESVKQFKPFSVTGDFNGDGVADLLVIVRITGHRSELPKDVLAMNPFELNRKATFPSDPAIENRLAIAIVHSWKSPQPAAKFLLIGESPILILDYERAVSGRAEDSKDLMSVMKRRGPRPKGQKFPATARGDVVLLANQVGDNSLLYWNGRTYRWQDSGEGD